MGFSRDGYRRIAAPTSTEELRRIVALPRYTRSRAEIEELADLLTSALRRPRSVERLRPIQALALAEAHDAGGLFAGMGVGTGKTLVSFLAPVIMGAERPLLLVPSALAAKTLREIDRWGREFTIHPGLRVLGYEMISHPDHRDDLAVALPDLIIADESHRIRNGSSSRGGRVRQYLKLHPECRLLCMSGTHAATAPLDFAHLMVRALGAGAPIPRTLVEIERWSEALGADTEEWARPDPKALLALSPPEEGEPTEPLARARMRFARRVRETRGIVMSTEINVSAKLLISRAETPPSARIADELATMAKTYRTPSGDVFRTALELYRYSRQVSLGYHYRWDPPPPDEWLAARAAWNTVVRDMLVSNRALHDSPALCARAVPNHPALLAWHAVRDLYDPDKNRRVAWFDDTYAQYAARWLREHPRGIAWVENIAFGARVAELASCEYLAGGTAAAERILDIAEPFVAGIRAWSEGVNLQDRYDQSLIASSPASAVTWEQLIGRTYREGQMSPRVSIECMLHAPPLARSFATALRRAKFKYEIELTPQRLLLAKYDFDVSEYSGLALTVDEDSEDDS